RRAASARGQVANGFRDHRLWLGRQPAEGDGRPLGAGEVDASGGAVFVRDAEAGVWSGGRVALGGVSAESTQQRPAARRRQRGGEDGDARAQTRQVGQERLEQVAREVVVGVNLVENDDLPREPV